MPKVERKVPVSRRALIARITRRLAKDRKVLKAGRGIRTIKGMGDYYIVDLHRNVCVALNVDPEALGRELGVLADYEEVRDD